MTSVINHLNNIRGVIVNFILSLCWVIDLHSYYYYYKNDLRSYYYYWIQCCWFVLFFVLGLIFCMYVCMYVCCVQCIMYILKKNNDKHTHINQWFTLLKIPGIDFPNFTEKTTNSVSQFGQLETIDKRIDYWGYKEKFNRNKILKTLW